MSYAFGEPSTNEIVNAVLTQARQDLVSVNSQTGTSYTLTADDVAGNVIVECTNAEAITLTVPLESSVPIPIGTIIGIRQGGAGVVSIAGAEGVTINALGDADALQGQYACAALEKTGSDTWVLTGAIE